MIKIQNSNLQLLISNKFINKMKIYILLLQLYLCLSLPEFEDSLLKIAFKQEPTSIVNPLIKETYSVVNTNIYPKEKEEPILNEIHAEIVKEQSKVSKYVEQTDNSSIQISNYTSKVSPIKDYWAVTNIYPEASLPEVKQPIEVHPQKQTNISIVDQSSKTKPQPSKSKKNNKVNSNLPYVLIAVSFVILVLLARYCNRKKKANKWGSIKRKLEQNPNPVIDIIETPASKEHQTFEMSQREKSNNSEEESQY